MSFEFKKVLPTEEETARFARTLVKWILKAKDSDLKIYLNGNLGAGKTTFSRYFIQAFGVQGAVKSPTYTLIEPYEINGFTILHADLYRLASPLEIFDLGLLEETGIWLIEWPEKGEGVLPASDIELKLNRESETLSIEAIANSPRGEELLQQVDEDF